MKAGRSDRSWVLLNRTKEFFITAVIILFALTPTFARAENLLYVFHNGTPVAIQNFVFPELGCDWMGIGGQAFDQQGEVVTGLIVKVSGTLEGNDVLQFAMTGNAQQLGPGGFGIRLSDRPIASQGTLLFQLFDLNGVPQRLSSSSASQFPG